MDGRSWVCGARSWVALIRPAGSESGALPAAAPTALSFSGATNRISGWSYDANGNLLSDGVDSF
ncbi:MAG: hypothetical protein EPN33_10925 [Acidobacteria bacterium]|nr:MAG: hypothetical protein EPN33_10925 [Acidobacteriota bacterium]